MSRHEVMTSGRQVGNDMVVLGIAVALAGAGLAWLLARKTDQRKRPFRSAEPAASPTITAARRLNRAAGILAFSVLTDSALEHYRGSFANPAMYTPLVVSLLSLAVSGHGVADRRAEAHLARDTVYSAAALAGLAGTAFHIYNIASRPGRMDLLNLFYGAPLGAPSALLLSGLLGFLAERVRDTEPGSVPRLFGVPLGRLTAAVTAGGLLGTAGEAGLLHFRGAYHNPFMYIPVTIPPTAAFVVGEMAVAGHTGAFARWWLRLTAAIGFAGAGFHAYGVHRNMGGWRNWRQNILNGPPIPAPPSFAGLALAGLAALSLMEEKPDA